MLKWLDNSSDFLDKNAVTGVLFSDATFCIQLTLRCWKTTAAGLPQKGLVVKESTNTWSNFAKLANPRILLTMLLQVATYEALTLNMTFTSGENWATMRSGRAKCCKACMLKSSISNVRKIYFSNLIDFNPPSSHFVFQFCHKVSIRDHFPIPIVVKSVA